ncbi:uncharacterized protein LOC122403580 [Colletes gigas]|uniref:uncharacterized protein LOC122403580 n=1 Tax=Colletes gigas TaxID=935657 RepID=UPI001C9B45AD|nr:uncharacterized protein LOC122403580 [Colletes gigas]
MSTPIKDQGDMRSILSHLEMTTTQMKRQEETMKKQDEALRKLLQTVKVLDEERVEQAGELKKLGVQLGFVVSTEDGRSIETSRRPATEMELTDDEGDLRTARAEPRSHTSTAPATTVSNLKTADALRMVETLYGKDDIGVEEFIKSVRFARNRVNDPESLLRMIITEKIVSHAKRSIRFCRIQTYDELYEALRTQVSLPVTVSGSRNKMQTIKQGITENVQSYTARFKQAMSELEYAIQAKHRNPIARNIALEEENLEAVKFYIYNLKKEIAQYVVPMRPKTLIEAQHEAMNIEVWCKDTRPTSQPQRPYMPPRTMTNNQPRPLIRPPSFIPKPANNPQQQIPRPVSCEHCGKQGHFKQNCFRLKQQNFPTAQFGKLPPPKSKPHEGDGGPRRLRVHYTPGELQHLRCSFAGMLRPGRFLLDTGAGVNLLKRRFVNNIIPLKHAKTIQLGNDLHQITHFYTFRILGQTHNFLIVPDNFPLIEDEHAQGNRNPT